MCSPHAPLVMVISEWPVYVFSFSVFNLAHSYFQLVLAFVRSISKAVMQLKSVHVISLSGRHVLNSRAVSGRIECFGSVEDVL
jgi:hypothetical protein